MGFLLSVFIIIQFNYSTESCRTQNIRVCERSAAMKAPVGLLSDRTVLRSKPLSQSLTALPAPPRGGAYKCFRSNTKKLPLSGELARSKATRLRGSSSYMFFLDKRPVGVLSLQHRDRAPADGTLWSTTVQLCGESQCRPSGQPCAIAAQSCPFLLSRRMSDENRYRNRTGS